MVKDECEKCPPAIKLKSLCKDIDKLAEARKDKWDKYNNEKKDLWSKRDTDYEHWEEQMSKRAKTGTLIAIASIVVVIVVALFAGIYNSTTTASVRIASSLEKATDKMDVFQNDIREEVMAVKVEVIKIVSQVEAHIQHTEKMNSKHSR